MEDRRESEMKPNSSLKRSNILLVDDKPKNLLVLEEVLRCPEYNLVKARSGEEVLRLLLENEFSVILLDVQMPVMDGFETAHLIRERERTRDVPIIFLTAEYDSKEHVVRAYSLNASDYVIKPFDPDILKARVALWVELQRKSKQLNESNRQLQSEIQQRKRAEKDLARRLEQQEREIHLLERYSTHRDSPVTGRMYGQLPLRQGYPDIFKELVRSYGELLDRVLEQRVFKVEYDTSKDLCLISEQMGLLKAGPRDVVDLHSATFKEKSSGTTAGKAQGYAEEGRLTLLELMGYLVSFYRNYYPGLRKASGQEAGEQGESKNTTKED